MTLLRPSSRLGSGKPPTDCGIYAALRASRLGALFCASDGPRLLDYWNAVLTGAADIEIKRLYSVQNTAAPLVLRHKGHIAPLQYALPVLKCIHSVAPIMFLSYTNSLCRWKMSKNPRLLSASTAKKTGINRQRSFAFYYASQSGTVCHSL